MSEHFWDGRLAPRCTAPISEHPRCWGRREGVREPAREFPFLFLVPTAWLAPRLRIALRRNCFRLPALRSAQHSKAKELDRLSFTKPFMKVSLLDCWKIQKESNFGSLRQWQEGPGGVPHAASERLRRSHWKCDFFPVNYLQPTMLHWELLPFWKDFSAMKQLTKVILWICFWDDNILIRYARIFYPSPGCHILTFSHYFKKTM